MKVNISKVGLAALFGALVLVGASAWAADKGHLNLVNATNVAGTKLASGDYSVQWEGTGDQVQLKIYKGKKEMASTTAKVVQLKMKAISNNATVSKDNNGESNLTQIQFAGKKIALDIGGEGVSSASAAAGR